MSGAAGGESGCGCILGPLWLLFLFWLWQTTGDGLGVSPGIAALILGAGGVLFVLVGRAIYQVPASDPEPPTGATRDGSENGCAILFWGALILWLLAMIVFGR